MPNSNEPTRTYNDIPPLTAIELGAVIARVKEGEEIIGNVPLPVPVNKGGTNATTALTARTNLGLGTIATQAANSVAITGGSIAGITDLAVADGGTGTSNGSITGTEALTFAAGGTNQDINLNPSGTGRLIAGAVAGTEATINLRSQEGVDTGFTVSLPNNSANASNGIYLRKGSGFFAAANANSATGAFLPYFRGKDTGTNFFALGFVGLSGTDTPILSAIYFSARNSTETGGVSASGKAFYFENGYSGGTSSAPCLTILGNGNSTFHSSTESTSTSTGAVVIDGGLGVAKNVNIGGNLRFAGGTVPATATSAGITGDIRYDGSYLYICTATNTWVRTALSTW